MNTLKTILIGLFMTAPVVAQDSTSRSTDTAVTFDDIAVVRTILDKCGMKNAAAMDICKMEAGRVTSINLSNPDMSTDGFSVLPPEIGKLTALKTFICKDNSLKTIPPEIGNLTELTKLDLSSNDLISIPPEVGNLTKLEDLDLRNNELTDLPDEIRRLTSLVYLRLWVNKITSLNVFVIQLPSLKELYLKDNRLTTLPVGIVKMKSLTYIDYIGNKICDPCPAVDEWLKSKDKLYRQTQKCW